MVEHGKESEKQHYTIDIGIVVSKNAFREKKKSPRNMTSIIVDTNDEMSSITSITGSSKKKQKQKKKEVFVAPKKLHVYVMHPVVYDEEKGSYETPHTTVLSDFFIDFGSEEFVEYRLTEDFGSGDCDEEAALLDGIERLLEQNCFDEDKLKSNILQPLRNKLGNHIFKKKNCTSFYKGKVGCKSALFISTKRSNKREMKMMRRSNELERFFRDNNDTNKWEGSDTLPIKLAFGAALEDDEKVGGEYFMDGPLDEDVLCLSVASVNEPKVKEDKKKMATASKDNASVLRSFLDKCYRDEDSPFHHGFVDEMKTLMFNMTIINHVKMKIVCDIEKDNVFSLPTPLINHFKSCLFANKMKLELEGLTIKKGKYPPIENNIPNLAQWKRTSAGQEHCDKYGNKAKKSDGLERAMERMFELQTALASSSTTTTAAIAAPSTKENKRVGMIEIRTGVEVVKVYYSSDAEDDNTISLTTSLKDVLLKAKKWKGGYDKSAQERIFEIKYSDGRIFTSYKKKEIENVTLDQLLNIMAFPISGEVLHIHGNFQDITVDDDEGDSLSV